MENILPKNPDLIATSSIKNLAFIFARQWNATITWALKGEHNGATCGFWFCGFDNESNRPQMYEVCWHKDNHNDITLKVLPHEDLLRGGDGAQFINFDFKNYIFNKDIQYAIDLHEKLYVEGEEKQASEGSIHFGGHKHRLLITASSCEWLIPPAEHTD